MLSAKTLARRQLQGTYTIGVYPSTIKSLWSWTALQVYLAGIQGASALPVSLKRWSTTHKQ